MTRRDRIRRRSSLGLEGVRLGPIRAKSGEALTRKRNSDAEGLTLVDGTPEQGTCSSRSSASTASPGSTSATDGLSPAQGFVDLPPGAKNMTANKGLEADCRPARRAHTRARSSPSPRTLPDAAGDHTGWLWVKGKPSEIHLTNLGDYDVTDAAALPDGGLLVLERRFRWSEGVKSRLRLIRRDELKPGARIEGEMLL